MKSKTHFVCHECGFSTSKWTGQCAGCGAWNSLEEQVVVTKSKTPHLSGNSPKVTALSQVNISEVQRFKTFSDEFDRVLGGGIVPGSVVLIGGDPGIGKSTLLLQTLVQFVDNLDCLYVSGEESPQQIALRAQRLGLDQTQLNLLSDNQLENTLAAAQHSRPEIMVVDSVQTVYSEALTSAPGSVSQVKEATTRLVRYAKESGCCVILVGHVTKEGAIAGPKILEHMVDTVLYFEGDSDQSFRLLRAIKNRFGSVNEIGVFAMTEQGLKTVSNPSAMFINRSGAKLPGSIILATQEGSRPLLVEVQALVDDSIHPQARRLAVGLDASRLSMLLAICHRHAGISLAGYDVYTNVVGGMRIQETGADLAIILAILSSLKNKPLGTDLVAFGEIGLAGEVRPVQRGLERIREAQKLGFKRVVVAQANQPKSTLADIEVIAIRRLDEINTLFE